MNNNFYKSKVWIQTSKSYALSKYLLCERCGRAVYCDGISNYLPKEKRLRYIVHHKKRLNATNVYDDSIALDWNNLELLCIDCHNSEHNPSVSTREDLKFDEMGNLIKSPRGRK